MQGTRRYCYFFKQNVTRRSKVRIFISDAGVGAAVARGEMNHALAGRVRAAVEFRMDAPNIVAQKVGAHEGIVGEIIGNQYRRGAWKRHLRIVEGSFTKRKGVTLTAARCRGASTRT